MAREQTECDECGEFAPRLYRLTVDGEEGRYCAECRGWFVTHCPPAEATPPAEEGR